MSIQIPRGARAVLDTLHAHGFEAYVVGGCVRDLLLARTPEDFDVTTSALPEQIMELFDGVEGFKAYPTGIKHGTVTVATHGENVETTTFRIDGSYTDGRRPDSVRFTASVEEDLARRDFTVNAMAYADETGLVDPFDGQTDLKKRLIRCVGDPKKRFSEDALRILRAIRFAAVLGFSPEPETAQAAISMRSLIKQVAWERIRVELIKLLGGEYAPQVLVEYFPILCEILPELAACKAEEIGARLEKIHGASEAMLLAALFADCDGADNILQRLRCSRQVQGRTVEILSHFRMVLSDKYAIRRLCHAVGVEAAGEIIRFGIVCETIEPSAQTLYEAIVRDGDCTSLSSLQISGDDLRALGASGKVIGELLAWLLEGVMTDAFENQREPLRLLAAEKLCKMKER